MLDWLKEIDDLDYHIPRFAMILMALAQLAFSQIHIRVVILLFVREIGFFLFGFIFAGIIGSFLLISMQEVDRNGFLRLLIPTGITIVFGAYVLFLILTDTATVPFSTLQNSVFMLIASVVVNVLGLVAIAIAGVRRRNKAGEVVQN